MLYWFELWREFKLSLAEIFKFFSEEKIEFINKKFLILEINSEKNWEKIKNIAEKLWWTIKIFEVEILDNNNEIFEKIFEVAQNFESKFNYALNIFSEKKLELQKYLIKTKKYLREKNISSRFANKNNFNLSSSQILGNNLIKKWADFNLINTKKNIYFWKTIWVQDINSYSKRDFSKTRDMQIWMLPVKLAQIMINLSRNPNKEIKAIYDPFVWLGTILIEAKLMGIKNIFWSDFNEKMVETTKNNLKDFKDIKKDIFYLDARDTFKLKNIENSLKNFLEKNEVNIVTEWFLWKIMTKKNINISRIEIQRKNLKKLYEKFFSWLKKINFSWNIVISFPFWELNKKYFYFEEIYEIIKKYCEILPLLPENIEFKVSKSWSLLYKRDSQLVWREIFCLKIKD